MICIRTYKKNYINIINIIKDKNIRLNYHAKDSTYNFIVLFKPDQSNSAWRSNRSIEGFSTDFLPNKEKYPAKFITSKRILSNPESLDAMIFDILL